MEIAQALHSLWRRKFLVAFGLVVALAVGFLALKSLKKDEYATAQTQMIVDSPKSPLGNTGTSLDPFTARASVFADLMVSHPALVEIGAAAHLDPNQIAATGPANPDGTTTVSPIPPSSAQPVTKYKLFVDQDPTLPTVNVYAEAPTTDQAVALANGAVTGFATYLNGIESQKSIKTNQRVEIRQLGEAVGGMVDPHASKKIAAIVVVLVLLIWCGFVLLLERKRTARTASVGAETMPATVPDPEDDPRYAVRTSEWSAEAGSELELDAVGNGAGNGNGHRDGNGHAADRDAKLAQVAGSAESASAPDER